MSNKGQHYPQKQDLERVIDKVPTLRLYLSASYKHLISGKTKIRCKCGKKVTINGITSHSKICDLALISKREYITNVLPQTCILCDQPVKRKSLELRQIIRLGNPYFCSKECATRASYLVKIQGQGRIKDCPGCGQKFITTPATPSSCSRKCSSTSRSQSLKVWHKQQKHTPEYKSRCKKISQTRIERQIGVGGTPWNKGLSGDEYLQHYIDDNGDNRLYIAIADNNLFFKETSIESCMKRILEELGLSYKYNFFFKRHQYDFYVAVSKNKRLIIECDGDYWHRSSRRCDDPTIRAQVREQDKSKEKFIIGHFSKNNRKIDVVRFWEYNINNNEKQIQEFLQELQKNGPNYEATLCKIKEYYEENC